VHQTRGLGYLAWELRPSGGGPTVVTGFDVAVLDDDRIADLYTIVTSTAQTG
jgi:hypothetical protein